MLPAYKKSYTHYSTPSGNSQFILYRRKATQRQKEETIFYIKQKLAGLLMIAVGIIAPLIADGDATVSLFVLPIGVYLILTREKVMML